MPFVRRQDLDSELRAASIKRVKGELRASLLNPGLSAEQRQMIQEELTLLDAPGKIYDANRPPRPGAI